MLGVLKNKAIVVTSIALVASVVLGVILFDTKEKITPLRGEPVETERIVEFGPSTLANALYDEDAYAYSFDIIGTKIIAGEYDLNSVPFDKTGDYSGTFAYGDVGAYDFSKEDSLFEIATFDYAEWFSIEFQLIKRANVDLDKSVMTFTNITTSTTSYPKIRYLSSDDAYNYYSFELSFEDIGNYAEYGDILKLESLKLVFSC